ncbi:cellulose biosynthesis protein BcsF, partial [Klebsiella pneumoniae]|nr:cellulose biosynthesis protein BcsF [Klebsiella pneumoniae]
MMTISDIIEIIVVCALIFFPLGYLARTLCDAIRDTL